MEAAASHYRHSGRVGPVGFVITPPVAVLVGVLLGVLYGLLSFYSPRVWLNVIGTFGAPLAIGWVTGMTARLGHVRRPGFAALCAFGGGLLATWANWVAWISAATNHEVIAWFPPGIALGLVEMSKEGVWTVFGWTPTGAALLGIWALEALIFLVLAPVTAAMVVSSATYCETCRRWLGKPRAIATRATPADIDALAASLHAGDVEALAALPPAAAGADDRIEALELRCDGCDGVHLLTVERVRLKEPDKKGKREEDRNALVDRLVVDNATFERVRAKPRESAAPGTSPEPAPTPSP